MIHAIIGDDVQNLCLMGEGQTLEDARTLADYHLTPSSQLDVIVLAPETVSSINTPVLYPTLNAVKTSDGKSLPLCSQSEIF
jgi:hypothetical protein